MRTSTTARLAALLAVLFLFVGAACDSGNGDDNDASSESDDTTEQTDDTDDNGDSAPPSDDATGASGYCDEFRQVLDTFAGLDDGTDTFDPETLRPALEMLAAIEAPGEIADAWATFIESFGSFIDLYSQVDVNDPSSFESLDQAQFQEISAQLEEASSAISAYATAECGFNPDEL